MKKFALILGTFLLLALTTIISAASAQIGSMPTLDVLTPSERQTIYGDKVPVLLDAQNFEIVDFANNTKAVSGQGHVHLWLDDEQMTAQSAAKAIEDTFTFSDVPAGDHKLRVELVANDHSSLKPPVAKEISFKTAPVSSAVPSEATSGFDKKTALVIFIVVALVIIAAWWYTKDEDEEETKSQSEKSKSKVTKKKTVRSRKK